MERKVVIEVDKVTKIKKRKFKAKYKLKIDEDNKNTIEELNKNLEESQIQFQTSESHVKECETMIVNLEEESEKKYVSNYYDYYHQYCWFEYTNPH